jgi:hypothetical protein
MGSSLDRRFMAAERKSGDPTGGKSHQKSISVSKQPKERVVTSRIGLKGVIHSSWSESSSKRSSSDDSK